MANLGQSTRHICLTNLNSFENSFERVIYAKVPGTRGSKGCMGECGRLHLGVLTQRVSPLY